MLHLRMGLILRTLLHPEVQEPIKQSVFENIVSRMRNGREGAAYTKLGTTITPEAKLLLKHLTCTAEGQQSFNWLGCKHLFGLLTHLSYVSESPGPSCLCLPSVLNQKQNY